MQARRRELFAVQAASAEMRGFALLPEANHQGTTQTTSVSARNLFVRIIGLMPYDSHSDTIDEMKNRLERMESLLLAGTRSSVDDNRAGSSVRHANQDDASYCLMDRIGFSSFIGATILLLGPLARRKFTVSVRFRVRIRSPIAAWSAVGFQHHTLDRIVGLCFQQSADIHAGLVRGDDEHMATSQAR
jgi:hypothetical protein